ncbi:MAG: prolipoprotein diacylglyceryl transferase [Saprospirales bacterium]|nr:prolipoprotein diacylglyceryl transferase [Saprospirales bacterium]
MYPDLSYLFHDLFGSQPDNWTSIFKTFGLLLVISILTAAFMLFRELRRKKEEGIFVGEKVKVVEGGQATWTELLSNGVFGFIIGFKLVYLLQHFEEFQRDAADVLLSTKGTLWAGLLFGLAFAGIKYWEKYKNKGSKPTEKTVMIYPHDRIGDITIWAAVSGIVGAKIFAIIEDLPNFFADPIGTFFSGSGLAIYGGLIGGFLGVSWYLRQHKIPFWPVADAVAPALMIAYGIGRLGCHFSGDGDWGIAAAAQPEWWFLPNWLWAFDYPHNVAQDGVALADCVATYCRHLEPPVYPTPLYETLMAFLIGGFLWFMRKRLSIAGMLFFLYLMLNGVERFLIEQIRVNIKYDLWGFHPTQAEIIAVAFFLLGAIGMFVVWRKNKTVE